MVSLKVRVTPGARDDAIIGWREDVLRVRLRAVPERGKANAALCRLLAQKLGVAASTVAVVRGAGSRKKVVAVDGLTDVDVIRIISAQSNTP